MTPVLEVRHLRLVRAIVEEGGPTRAAARLHISQSAVSHQLTELEERLGVELFARVRRKLELTKAGARNLDLARTTLSEIGRVERELHHPTPPRQVLRIAVETFTAYHWLPPVVAALAREHHGVEVRIIADARRDPLAALLRGALEVALVCTPPREPTLVASPLFSDEWAVIASPSHPFAAKAWISAADLAQELVLANDASRSDVERLREHLAVERASMPQVSTVPFTDALVDLVAGGVGVGLVSRWAVEPWIRRRAIVSRRFTRGGLAERWFAVHRRNNGLPLSRFVELVATSTKPRRRRAPPR